jgi:Arc/MetJ family transcription regulator
MRTTVEINDELFRSAKAAAAKQNKSLREIVDEALRRYLKGPETKKFRLKLTPHNAVGHLMPGVDLEDRDSLYDIMDGLR